MRLLATGELLAEGLARTSRCYRVWTHEKEVHVPGRTLGVLAHERVRPGNSVGSRAERQRLASKAYRLKWYM